MQLANTSPLQSTASGLNPESIHQTSPVVQFWAGKKGVLIGSAVFALYTSVTDEHTQTDTQTMLRATSVAIGRICYACYLV